MPHDLTPWQDLPPSERTRLRTAYGTDPACLTGTCALDAKIAHFAAWLAARGVRFTADDLRTP